MTYYPTPPQAPKRRFRWRWVVAPVAAVMVSSAVVVGAVSLLPNETRTATEKCRADVMDQLKSPSTAQFSEVERMGAEDEREFVRDLTIRDDENPIVVIQGLVDSQNGFGAMVRTGFVCTAQRFGPVWTTNTTLSE